MQSEANNGSAYVISCSLAGAKNEVANEADIGDLQVKAVAEKGLSKPLSIGGGFLKLLGGSAADKLADFYRNTVENLKIMVLRAAEKLKKALFNMPQIRTLPDKITSVRQLGKQRSPVTIKVLINPLIGVESQVFTDPFHGDHLTVGQPGQWSTRSQRASREMSFTKIICHDEHIDDIIHKYHVRPPCLNEVFDSPLLSAMRSFFSYMCEETRTTR